MRAELFAPAGFVASFDCPPFKVPPEIMMWGNRTFKLAGEQVHLPDCNSVTKQMLDKAQEAPCSCDGAHAYDEVKGVWTLADMHQIEAPRSAPVTRKPR